MKVIYNIRTNQESHKMVKNIPDDISTRYVAFNYLVKGINSLGLDGYKLYQMYSVEEKEYISIAIDQINRVDYDELCCYYNERIYTQYNLLEKIKDMISDDGDCVDEDDLDNFDKIAVSKLKKLRKEFGRVNKLKKTTAGTKASNENKIRAINKCLEELIQ